MSLRDLIQKAASKPPPGYTPIPGGKHGGYRKKVGGKWVRWYPPERGAQLGLFGRKSEETVAPKQPSTKQLGLFGRKVAPGVETPPATFRLDPDIPRKDAIQGAAKIREDEGLAPEAPEPQPASPERTEVALVENASVGDILQLTFPKVRGARRRKWMESGRGASYRVTGRSKQGLELAPLDPRRPKATLYTRVGFAASEGDPRHELDVMLALYDKSRRWGHTTGHPVEAVLKEKALSPTQQIEAFGEDLKDIETPITVSRALAQTILALDSLPLLRSLRVAIQARLDSSIERRAEAKAKAKKPSKAKAKKPRELSLRQLVTALDKRIAQLELALKPAEPTPSEDNFETMPEAEEPRTGGVREHGEWGWTPPGGDWQKYYQTKAARSVEAMRGTIKNARRPKIRDSEQARVAHRAQYDSYVQNYAEDKEKAKTRGVDVSSWPVVPPYDLDVHWTTPGTNLKGATLGEWSEAWRELDRRRASSARGKAREEHLRTLPDAVVAAATDAEVDELERIVRDVRPPRGMRAGHPTTEILDAISRRRSRGQTFPEPPAMQEPEPVQQDPRPEATTPEPVAIQTEGEIRAEEAEGRIVEEQVREEIVDVQGGERKTKGQRKEANERALEIIEKAQKAKRGLTDEEMLVVAEYTGRGGVGADLNQYYTRSDIAKQLWNLSLRYSESEVTKALEPACGAGVFLSTAPAGIKVQGVEIDQAGAMVSSALHEPRGHSVAHSSLEEYSVARTGMPPEMDVVISNAPFCTRTGGVAKLHKPEVKSADHYFLDTALDEVKDGGIVSMIVHSGVLNSAAPQARAFRERLLARAEIVDAYRLPGEAFKHTHTEVVSDVLVLRKRPRRIGDSLASLARRGELEGPLAAFGAWDEKFLAGDYFEDRPERVLGTALSADETGWREKVTGDADAVAGKIRDLSLQGGGGGAAATRISVEEFEELAGRNDRVADALRAADSALAEAAPKVGDTQMIGRIRYLYIGDPPRWQNIDTVDDVTQIIQQTNDAALRDAHDIAERIEDLRKAVDAGEFYKARNMRRRLSTRVDEWVAEHGIPSSHKTLVELARSAPVLLDFLASVGDLGQLSDLLSKDAGVVVASGAVDTSSLSSVLEHVAKRSGGVVELSDARSWTGAEGLSDEQLRQRILDSKEYAVSGSGFKQVEDYLTGNLFDLLASETAKLAEVTESWHREALEQQIQQIRDRLQSKRKSLDDIDVQFRVMSWVPVEAFEAWLNTPETQRALFHVWHDKGPRRRVQLRNGVWQMGWERGDGSVVWSADSNWVLRWMNRLAVNRNRAEEVLELQTQFNDWLRGSDYRSQVEDIYNRLYRSEFAKEYSPDPLGFDEVEYDSAGNITKAGLNPVVTPHPFQNQCIRWAAESGKGVIALDVGLGKTFAGILLARLLKQQGKARRPMVVVPKSVATNWLEETQFLTPGARVLVIGETAKPNRTAQKILKRAEKEGRELTSEEAQTVKANTKSVSDSADERNRKLAMMRQNEYDLVICTQPAFARIPMRESTLDRFGQDDFTLQRARELDSLGTGGNYTDGSAAEKKLTKLREAFSQKLVEKEFKSSKDLVYWEDLGVDCLMADEAHAYKNLRSAQSRFGGKPKFLGGSAESKIAQKMEYMSRVVREASPDNGVFFLTATPTKNSPLELYNMLQHIAPEAFLELGIRNSEEFIDRFCRLERRLVLTPPGKKQRTKDDDSTGSDDFEGAGNLQAAEAVVGFQNLSELEGILDKYMMVRTAQDVNLKIPESNSKLHAVEMTKEQKQVYQSLRAEAAELDREQDPGGQFRIMDRMKKAAQDLELYDPERFEGAHKDSPKYKAAVKNIVEGARERGGQIVFVDHNASHERLKGMLVDAGMRPEEIEIINAQVAKDSATRQQIGARFNRGEVKVVIGNTGTMGEGVNLQGKSHSKGTTDIHHLDQPWDPGTFHQRNGRGIRQGNRAEQCDVHTYVSKASFDGFRLGTLKGKESWLQRLRSGVDTLDNDLAQDVDDLDVLVMLSEDPDEARAEVAQRRKKAEIAFYAKACAEDVKRFYKLQALSERRDRFAAKGAEQDVQSITMSMDRLRKQLLRSEILPLEIRQELQDNGDSVPTSVVRLNVTQTVEGETRASAEIVRQGVVFEHTDLYSKQTTHYVVESVDRKAETVKLRQFGQPASSNDRSTLVSSLVPYKLTELTTEDELAEILQKEFRPYSNPGSAMVGVDEPTLVKRAEEIRDKVRQWLGQNARPDKLVPVRDGAGIRLAPVIDIMNVDQLRSRVSKLEEKRQRKRERDRAKPPRSEWERKYNADRDKRLSDEIASVRAKIEAFSESSLPKLALPFGEDAEAIASAASMESWTLKTYASRSGSPILTALEASFGRDFADRVQAQASRLASQRKAAA